MKLALGILMMLGITYPMMGQGKTRTKELSSEQSHCVDISPGDLYWLFHNACFCGDKIGVKILLRAGADVDGIQGYEASLKENDANGHQPNRPINDAAREGHTNIVKILLEAGAEVDNPDWEDEAALLWAAVGGHSETVELLLAAGADPSRNDSSALKQARNLGHEKIEEMLLEAKREAGQDAGEEFSDQADQKAD